MLKSSSKRATTAPIKAFDRRRHLCPDCHAPCDLYIRAMGWLARGRCPQGHDHPRGRLVFAIPPTTT